MKRIILNVVIVLQVLCLTSCLTTRQTNLLQDPGLGIPSFPREYALQEEYRIKMGDQLQIVITANPMEKLTSQLFSFFSVMNSYRDGVGESIRSFSVKPDGTIFFPYLGDIYVKGKTTLEIQQLIEKRINDSISDDCIVRVFLESRYFSMIGEAVSNGRYPIAKEQMTIHQALAQCGGIKSYGDRAHIKIIRQKDGGTMIRTFDLRSKDIVNSEFYYIQPNDVIYVQPLGRRFIGIDSFGAVFALFSTVASVGFMIYNFIRR